MVAAPRPIPDAVRATQARASDPAASAFVSANAGSGKTHVLVQRVIRLLLDGVPPEKILERPDNPTGRAVVCFTPEAGVMCFILPPQS